MTGRARRVHLDRLQPGGRHSAGGVAAYGSRPPRPPVCASHGRRRVPVIGPAVAALVLALRRSAASACAALPVLTL